VSFAAITLCVVSQLVFIAVVVVVVVYFVIDSVQKLLHTRSFVNNYKHGYGAKFLGYI
jgi:uncharacterized protein HemY